MNSKKEYTDLFEEIEKMEREEQQKQNAPKKKKRWLIRVGAVLLALALVAGGFAVGWFGYYYSLEKEMREFLWAYGVAERNYYQEIDKESFYENLYSALNLDPYSRFYPAEEYTDYKNEGAGISGGVGLSFTDANINGATVPQIFMVTENSPSCRAGLRKGMYVYGFGTSESSMESGKALDIVNFVSKTTEEFVLSCGYSLDGADAKFYSMKRESYQAAYVHYRDSQGSLRFQYEKTATKKVGKLVEGDEAIPALDDKTAYIRLDEFSGNAADEFYECLQAMKERGRENLILDLRTNGGGFLDTFMEIASYMLRNAENGSSPIVAKSVYRSGREEVYRSRRCNFGCFTENSRVIVLADENTASASECLIGALVDYGTVEMEDIILRRNDKGIAKTYGKGIMQTSYTNFTTGSAMKLTVAKIVWPSGKSIHGVGVTEEDGATAVDANLVWGNLDPMLEEAIKKLTVS